MHSDELNEHNPREQSSHLALFSHYRCNEELLHC